MRNQEITLDQAMEMHLDELDKIIVLLSQVGLVTSMTRELDKDSKEKIEVIRDLSKQILIEIND